MDDAWQRRVSRLSGTVVRLVNTPSAAEQLVEFILGVDGDARDLLLLLVVDPDIGNAARRLHITRRSAVMRLMRIRRSAGTVTRRGTMEP